MAYQNFMMRPIVVGDIRFVSELRAEYHLFAALRRAEWPHMRPNLPKGQNEQAIILTHPSPWPRNRRFKRLPNVDWTNPSRSGLVFSQ